MEKLLRALERRFGRFAIQNIAIILVAPKVAFFLFTMSGEPSNAGHVGAAVQLVPRLILEGQVWRIVSFIVTPPTYSVIFFLIYIMLTFLFCNALQQQWGALRLNVYILLGWALTVAGSFVANALEPGYSHPQGFAQVESTLLLGFATLYPNFEFRLFFILPVKVKWIGLIAAGSAIYAFGTGPWDEAYGYAHRVMLLCAFANYLLFFGPALIRGTHQKHQASSRRRDFEAAMRRGDEERKRGQQEDSEARKRDEEED